MAIRKRAERVPHAGLITLCFALGTFLLIGVLYVNALSGAVSPDLAIIFAILVLGVTGVVIRRANGLEGTTGLYVFGGRTGIATIERLARNRRRFWEFFAQVGMVVSFGLLSYFIFRKQIEWKALVVGLIVAAVLLFVLFPYTSLALQFIKLPHGGTAAQLTAPTFQFSLLTIALAAATLLGGFALFFGVVLVVAAGLIGTSLFTVASSIVTSQPVNATILANTSPGLVPALPGLTLPFFAGICALAVLLVVHEFSHGILSTIYKAKVKRVGLVMFGVIPIGAFVDPDNNKVKKLSALKQNRIFIAGVTANFMLTFIFFVLAVPMLTYVAPALYTTHVIISAVVPGSPAALGGITANSTIVSWNNYAVTDLSSLQPVAAGDKPNGPVNVVTNAGTYNLTANASGKIGVELMDSSLSTSTAPWAQFLMFLYQFVVLSLALNFFVALVNLMPVPGFDGWHIYRSAVRNPKALYALSIITLALIIVLALPWIWSV